MANPICTRDSFITGSACFKIFDSQHRRGLLIYLKAKELAAIGGTDYTAGLGPAGSLNTAATAYKTLNTFERELSRLVIARNNAVTAGASIPSDIGELAEAIECVVNFPEPVKDDMLLVLECALGVHADYPQ